MNGILFSSEKTSHGSLKNHDEKKTVNEKKYYAFFENLNIRHIYSNGCSFSNERYFKKLSEIISSKFLILRNVIIKICYIAFGSIFYSQLFDFLLKTITSPLKPMNKYNFFVSLKFIIRMISLNFGARRGACLLSFSKNTNFFSQANIIAIFVGWVFSCLAVVGKTINNCNILLPSSLGYSFGYLFSKKDRKSPEYVITFTALFNLFSGSFFVLRGNYKCGMVFCFLGLGIYSGKRFKNCF